MKPLKKYPIELIQQTCENFCNELWKLSDLNREMGAALNSFEHSMQNWIIQELTASSIVEEE